MLRNLRITIVWTLLASLVFVGALLAAGVVLSQNDQDVDCQESAAVTDWPVPPAPTLAVRRQARVEAFSPAPVFTLLSFRNRPDLPLEPPHPFGKDLLTFIHVSRT